MLDEENGRWWAERPTKNVVELLTELLKAGDGVLYAGVALKEGGRLKVLVEISLKPETLGEIYTPSPVDQIVKVLDPWFDAEEEDEGHHLQTFELMGLLLDRGVDPDDLERAMDLR